MTIPFVPPLDDMEYGRVDRVSPLVRRVVAENPSKYSYRGTGTYIVGQGDVAVIDPGPRLDSHRDALRNALAGERVRAILITHCHGDHSPLAAWLREETGAPTYGFGPHGLLGTDDEDDLEPRAGDTEDPADAGPPPGNPVHEEPVDLDFVPDNRLVDGELLAGPGWTFEAVHTPGHTSNHLCFALAEEAALFSGDHVMGWSTTVVTPPDGDMRSYCDSLRKLLDRDVDRTYWPTHGNPIEAPRPFVEAYLDHRLQRERQIVAAVHSGLCSIGGIVANLYAEVRPELHRAASRSVFAHLRKLVEDGEIVVGDGRPTMRATYLPASDGA